jgi:DNA polymerase III subunit delta
VSTWSDPKLAPFTLLFGTESYLASRATHNIRQLARSEHPNLEIHTLEDYQPGQLLEAAAPSLFQEPRLIMITAAASGLAEDLEALESLAPEAVYVVVRLTNLVGQGAKIKKAMASAQLIKCDELKRESDRAEFVKREFASRSQTIDADALRALLAAFAEDLGELGAACEQLGAAADARVSRELVDSIFMGRVETNSFKIADAALAGNAVEAIRLLRHGLATGIDTVALTAALAMRVRQLAKIFGTSASPESLGMQAWQLDRARKDLAGRSEEGLAELVRMTAECDHAVKGASRDPQFAIEKLLLAMAARN